jgi:hypothetical protein
MNSAAASTAGNVRDRDRDRDLADATRRVQGIVDELGSAFRIAARTVATSAAARNDATPAITSVSVSA